MFKPQALRSEVYFEATRSRGPGGQNVNRTSSAAILYWDFEHSRLLTPAQKDRVRMKLSAHINAEGILYLRADEFRDLERNKARCLEKLADWVQRALHRPKRRIATKPTRSSVERRLEGKRQRSQIKSLRRRSE